MVNNSHRKTALVTGGTDGVGLSIVNALVGEQYDVYFIGSNQHKGKAAESWLHEQAGAGHEARIEFICLDLGDPAGVKAFATDFLARIERLDVLLLSAGVLLPRRTESAPGIEATFAIGYLSAYILANALVPALEQADHARVLTVSGGGAIVLKERLDFDNLSFETGYNPFKAAAQAVHAKVVLTQILAESLADHGIDVNTFHPGIVKSRLGRNLPWPFNLASRVAAQLMPRASKLGVELCLSEELNGVTGCFFEGKKRTTLNFSNGYKAQLVAHSELLLTSD